METTLTERDKKLLYLLGFIVILFIFGWLLMRPMIKSIHKTGESIAAAKELKQENETKVMGLVSAQTLLDKFEADLEESTEEYYGMMDSSEIDKMFTSYVLGFGLRSKDLVIHMPRTMTAEEPYLYSEIAKTLGTAEKKESSESSSEPAEEKAEEIIHFTQTPLEIYSDAKMGQTDTTAAGICSVEVTMVMTGTVLREQKLLNDILVRPSIRVTGFAWDDMAPVVRTREDGTITVTESQEKQLTVMLQLYMYDRNMAGIVTEKEED